MSTLPAVGVALGIGIIVYAGNRNTLASIVGWTMVGILVIIGALIY